MIWEEDQSALRQRELENNQNHKIQSSPERKLVILN
jgi:hypothetical protein